MSYETKALNRISAALGGASKVQKNDILNEIAGNVTGGSGMNLVKFISNNEQERGFVKSFNNGSYEFYTYDELVEMHENDGLYAYYGNNGVNGLITKVDHFKVDPAWGSSFLAATFLYSSSYTIAQKVTLYSDNRCAVEGPQKLSTLTNLIDGRIQGSVRTINASTNLGQYAFAEGYTTTAIGKNSHAEGNATMASGEGSHAEGKYTTASGESSHAEGASCKATANTAHAEGNGSEAKGESSHAEGFSSTTSGAYSHAEGSSTNAQGSISHVEGEGTRARFRCQHVFGSYNVADPKSAASTSKGTYVEIVGNGVNSDTLSNARTLDWSGNEWLAGKLTVGAAPTADMDVATKKYVDDNAGGGGVTNLVDGSAAGSVRGVATAAESDSYTIGENAFAEGSSSTASGRASHAEGMAATASGNDSHAEGNNTTAAGAQSHAEGQSTTASGTAAHTEGFNTRADGNYAHAEGYNTVAGMYAHSEGASTSAAGNNSHAEGEGTSAKLRCQHVFGSYNVEDPSTKASSSKGTYVEIVGNGANKNARSNARTLDWDGNEQLAGSLTLGLGTADKVTITAAQLKQLLATLS